jgi:superfamily II DNA or RNA helicase
MMQTISKMNPIEIAEYQHVFGLILVDECHHIPAKTFRETIRLFYPYYLFGLTATPKRKHNDESLIYVHI